MLVPLITLTVGAVFAGYFFHDAFIGAETGGEFWKGSLAFNEHLMHAMHEVPLLVKLSATIVMILGFAIAWLAYIKDTTIPARFTATFPAVYQFLLNKWYWDELYNLIFVRPSLWLGRFLWKKGDEGTIDRFGPHGAAEVVLQSSRLAVRFQSGYLSSYAFVMLLGLVGFATWAMTR
jgi:NADH-quinone oxidoreductase subunit L